MGHSAASVNGSIDSIDAAISRFITEKNITKQAFADMLGITTNTLRWKREGSKDWRWSEVLLVSEITGATLEELAGGQ